MDKIINKWDGINIFKRECHIHKIRTDYYKKSISSSKILNDFKNTCTTSFHLVFLLIKTNKCTKRPRHLTLKVIIKGRDTISTSEIINDQCSKENTLEYAIHRICLFISSIF